MALAALAFAAISATVIGFLYWSMLSVIDSQIAGALSRETSDMTAAYAKGGYERLRRTVVDRASPQPDTARIYMLVSPEGTITGNLKEWPAGAPAPGGTADAAVDHETKAARVHILQFADGSRLLVGRALTERGNFKTIVEESLLSVGLANLLLGAAAGALLAFYARARLGEINAIAEEVLEGNLAVRVAPKEGRDEYDHLARAINAMLDRIQKLVATVRGVSENIAHDLRTPLNRLRGRLEVALLSPRSNEEYEAVLKRAVAECDTIVDTFNGILKIARIKAGALTLPRAPVDLAEVAAELADLYEAFGDECGVLIEVMPAPAGGVWVMGDAHLVSQAAANLLDNAIKYSPKGARVSIRAAKGAGGASLTVADSGPGIPEAKRAAMLDRFARLDQTSAKQGFGLGLSFAGAVAEWHGAALVLEDNTPGLKVSLRFPQGGR
jgi:signal transduction histidine kinase